MPYFHGLPFTINKNPRYVSIWIPLTYGSVIGMWCIHHDPWRRQSVAQRKNMRRSFPCQFQSKICHEKSPCLLLKSLEISIKSPFKSHEIIIKSHEITIKPLLNHPFRWWTSALKSPWHRAKQNPRPPKRGPPRAVPDAATALTRWVPWWIRFMGTERPESMVISWWFHGDFMVISWWFHGIWWWFAMVICDLGYLVWDGHDLVDFWYASLCWSDDKTCECSFDLIARMENLNCVKPPTRRRFSACPRDWRIIRIIPRIGS